MRENRPRWFMGMLKDGLNEEIVKRVRKIVLEGSGERGSYSKEKVSGCYQGRCGRMWS